MSLRHMGGMLNRGQDLFQGLQETEKRSVAPIPLVSASDRSNYHLPFPWAQTRQSDLTFAVIWDPEDGALQSFSGASLGKLTTYADDAVLQSQEKELPKPPPPVPVKTDSIMRLASWQTRFDRTRPLVQRGHTALQADRNVSMLFSDSEVRLFARASPDCAYFCSSEHHDAELVVLAVYHINERDSVQQ